MKERVSHLSANLAQRCLTSVIRWARAIGENRWRDRRKEREGKEGKVTKVATRSSQSGHWECQFSEVDGADFMYWSVPIVPTRTTYVYVGTKNGNLRKPLKCTWKRIRYKIHDRENHIGVMQKCRLAIREKRNLFGFFEGKKSQCIFAAFEKWPERGNRKTSKGRHRPISRRAKCKTRRSL